MQQDFETYADEIRQGLAEDQQGLYVAGNLESPVLITETVQDADALHELGFSATAPRRTWQPEFAERFRGLLTAVLCNREDRSQASKVCRAVHGIAESVYLFDLSTVWPDIPQGATVSAMIEKFGVEKSCDMIAELTKSPPWEPPKDPPKHRAAKTAADFQDADIKFLWYPYLPIGDYTVMMADGGTGKTILCCGIMAALAEGKPLPGEVFDGEGQASLIISAEDTGEILRKRLKASGVKHLERVHIIDCMDSVGMSISDNYEEFKETILYYKPSLVVIDPWHAFVGEHVDISRTNALRPILQKLANIAKVCGCSILLISHVNKRAQGENANNAATGSADLINAARSAFRVIFDGADDDTRIMVHTKTNYAPYGQSVKYRIDDGGVVWAGFSEITRATLEEAARRHSTPHETMLGKEQKEDIRAKLIQALKNAAGQEKPNRFTYDEFKETHGALIFGGAQPKRALDSIKRDMEADGYFLKTGIHILRGKQQKNGFLVQRIQEGDLTQLEIDDRDI